MVDRFQLLEDRFTSEELFSPLGHDFVFDLSLGGNRNILDITDEAKDIADKELSRQKKLEEAQKFLKKHNNSEQFLRSSFKFGIPLPSFNLFKLQVSPSFRLSGTGGILIQLRGQEATMNNIAKFLPANVPPLLSEKVVEHFQAIPTGEDIVQWLIDNDKEVADLPGVNSLVGRYFMPEKEAATAQVEHYIKAEATSGFYLDYKANDRWNGHFNLYALGRADFGIRADAQTVYQNSKILTDIPDDRNTTVHAMADYYLRYTNKDLRLLAGIEEIKLGEVDNNEEKGGSLRFNRGPLLRVHGDYTYGNDNIHWSPFVGIHKRGGYSLGEGAYGGITLGARVKNDRVGLYARGQWDKEYFTISPHMRLLFMQLGYLLKLPTTSEKDGIKLAAMHAVHFRLFF